MKVKIVSSLVFLFSFCLIVSCNGNSKTLSPASTTFVSNSPSETSDFELSFTPNSTFVEWDKNGKGFSFSSDEFFTFNKPIERCPLSYEATIELLDLPDDKGGVIFGNYGEITGDIISFEINSHGNPRFFCQSKQFGVKDIVFENVCLEPNKKIALSITIDQKANLIKCYIDGALKQVVSKDLTFEMPESAMMIGGDSRSFNSAFFKGLLYNFSIFSSTRSDESVANDTLGVDLDDVDLIAAFELTNSKKGVDIQGLSGPYLLINNCLWSEFFDQPSSYDYSVVVIGDTQTMNIKWPNEFRSIYDFILEHKETDKIVYSIGLGDITDCDSEDEWGRAKEQISRLDGVVPYALNRGNHDSSYMLNSFFFLNNDYYPSMIDGFYQNGKIENSYRLVDVLNQRYLIFTLDFGPDDDVLTWADTIINRYPNYRIIISTHAYLFRDGSTLDINDVWPPTLTGGYNNGDALWEKFIKHHNVDLVLCGHDPTDNVVLARTINENGFTVSQLLIDPQDMDLSEPYGMVAILYFSNEGNSIDVRYYSTVKKMWKKADSKISFNIN